MLDLSARLDYRTSSSWTCYSTLNRPLHLNTNLASNNVLIFFKPLLQTEQLPHLNQPCDWSELFFCSRRSNYRSKKLACWPYLHLDAFENIIEARTPYPVMTAETISSACFALLVVVFCCVIKIYTMVKSIPLSRNERVRVVYARDNQRALPVAREPTVYFPQAKWWTFTEPRGSEENRWFLTHYSYWRLHNIFGCKSRVKCSEVKSKGIQNLRSQAQRASYAFHC